MLCLKLQFQQRNMLYILGLCSKKRPIHLAHTSLPLPFSWRSRRTKCSKAYLLCVIASTADTLHAQRAPHSRAKIHVVKWTWAALNDNQESNECELASSRKKSTERNLRQKSSWASVPHMYSYEVHCVGPFHKYQEKYIISITAGHPVKKKEFWGQHCSMLG